MAFFAAATACWSNSSQDFCLTGPEEGGELVCGLGVLEPVDCWVGVGVGVASAGVEGVFGMVGEAGVGGGVTIVVDVQEVRDVEAMDPVPCAWDTRERLQVDVTDPFVDTDTIDVDDTGKTVT